MYLPLFFHTGLNSNNHNYVYLVFFTAFTDFTVFSCFYWRPMNDFYSIFSFFVATFDYEHFILIPDVKDIFDKLKKNFLYYIILMICDLD